MNRVLRWSVAAGAIGLAGCGGGTSVSSVDASNTEAKVTGTVKVRGKAMTEGEVRFDPTSAGRTHAQGRIAKILPDGTFEVTTLIGHNAVRISGPALKKEPTLEYATKVVEVTTGENKLDLDFLGN